MSLIICKKCGKKYSDKASACPNCKMALEPNTREKSDRSNVKNIIIVCLAVVVVALIGVLGNLYHDKIQLEMEYSEQNQVIEILESDMKNLAQANRRLRNETFDLESSLNEVAGAYSFFSNSAVCINTGSSQYHRFECERFSTANTFWIHNREYADYRGYSPCPICY